jgi:hypothetical protein
MGQFVSKISLWSFIEVGRNPPFEHEDEPEHEHDF